MPDTPESDDLTNDSNGSAEMEEDHLEGLEPPSRPAPEGGEVDAPEIVARAVPAPPTPEYLQVPANLRRREVLVLVALTALLDYLLYQGPGGLSYAIVIGSVPVALACFAPTKMQSSVLAFVTGALLLLAAHYVWQVDPNSIFVGACALAVFAVALTAGQTDVATLAVSCAALVPMSAVRWVHYARILPRKHTDEPGRPMDAKLALAVLIPLGITAVFAGIFLLANPILRDFTHRVSTDFWSYLEPLWETIRPSPARAGFWVLSLLFLAALLRPLVVSPLRKTRWITDEVYVDELPPEITFPYGMARNTLVAVNVLFLLYNLFDARYLVVLRELPAGYNHSQYAHQGAFGLTVALALSTFVLGGIFSGRLNFDPKIATLRKWAGIWIAQNFFLGIWVLLRLHMYIDYNGLTPMRIVALYGVAVVVVGVMLVTVKVFRKRSLPWLVRKELMALALTVVLVTVTPKDLLTWWVNTPLILVRETPRPAVQLIEQQLSPEGLMMLPPLLDHPDPVIAKGVAAFLGEWYYTEQAAKDDRRWTEFQASRAMCLRRIEPYLERIETLIPRKQWRHHQERLSAHTARWI